MEHTKAYQEFKKNGNTKFVRYSEGAEMYHMGVSKFMQMAKDTVRYGSIRKISVRCINCRRSICSLSIMTFIRQRSLSV